MNVNIILFDRGAGGNFLARVLTLDPVTVCLGKNNIASPTDRCDYYCYKELVVPPNTLARNGLSVWVDAELNCYYFPFSRGIEQLVQLNQLIIEPMHPDHYEAKLQLLGSDDQTKLYYIDTTNCKNWVDAQIHHKITTDTKHWQSASQPDVLTGIIEKQSAQAISLQKIIESELTFVHEYVRICNLMQLNSYPDLALKIYRTWHKTWGPL
jgi:hypothetical protein